MKYLINGIDLKIPNTRVHSAIMRDVGINAGRRSFIVRGKQCSYFNVHYAFQNGPLIIMGAESRKSTSTGTLLTHKKANAAAHGNHLIIKFMCVWERYLSHQNMIAFRIYLETDSDIHF